MSQSFVRDFQYTLTVLEDRLSVVPLFPVSQPHIQALGKDMHLPPFSRMLCLKVGSLSFKSLSLIGFMFQVYSIADKYFKFETTSSYSVNQNYEVDLFNVDQIPKLAICVRYTEIMDMKRFADLYPSHNTSRDWLSWRHIQSVVRIKDIFDLTPTSNESIAACFYRNTDGLKYMRSERTKKCNEKFRMKRFYMIDAVCYSYQLRPEFAFPMQAVSATMNYPSFMYGFKLSDVMAGANHTMLIVYYGGYPITSRLYATSYTRLEAGNRVQGVTLKFYRVQSFLLPPPFDTMCIRDSISCLNSCLDPLEDQLDRVFYANIIRRPILRRHLTQIDLRNESVRQIVRYAGETCMDRCTERDCYLSYTVTMSDSSWLATDNRLDDFYVHVKTPQRPGIVVVSIPRLSLMSFLIYVCNCFNTWFGIHFFFLTDMITSWKFFPGARVEPTDNRRLTQAERRQRIQRQGLEVPWYCGLTHTKTDLRHGKHHFQNKDSNNVS